MQTEKVERPDPLRVCGFKVRVVRGDASSRVAAPPNDGRLRVGSAEGNTLVLQDRAVSRLHLRMKATGDGVRVEDVGSTNGSWIGGARFRQIDVERNVDIEVGTSVIRVELDDARILEGGDRDGFGGLEGSSLAMRRVYRELAFAARSKELSVLILGETGTGKELAARAIHDNGPRARGRFVAVDCASLSPALIESQLFGHVKGAFTDAKTSRPGPFEEADGGTVFLDEIGELPLAQQAKLLRVLQERQVQRVGANKQVRVDVKVLAATRRNLLEEVNRGGFREDLYFRIAGEEVFLPSLRERPEDIPALAVSIARKIAEREQGLARQDLPAEVLQTLSGRDWPGNVRELEHAVHRYLLRGELSPPRTALRIAAAAGRLPVDDLLHLPYAEAVREFEYRFARQALEGENGDNAAAVRRLGIDRSTLYRILGRKAETARSKSKRA